MESSRMQYFNELVWRHEYATRYKYEHVRNVQDITLEDMEEMANDLQRLQRRRAKLQDTTISKMELQAYLQTEKDAQLCGSLLPEAKNDSRIYFKEKTMLPAVNQTISDAPTIEIPETLLASSSGTQTRLDSSIHIRSCSKPMSHRDKITKISAQTRRLVDGVFDPMFAAPPSSRLSKVRSLYDEEQENAANGDVIQLTATKIREKSVARPPSVALARVEDDF